MSASDISRPGVKMFCRATGELDDSEIQSINALLTNKIGLQFSMEPTAAPLNIFVCIKICPGVCYQHNDSGSRQGHMCDVMVNISHSMHSGTEPEPTSQCRYRSVIKAG